MDSETIARLNRDFADINALSQCQGTEKMVESRILQMQFEMGLNREMADEDAPSKGKTIGQIIELARIRRRDAMKLLGVTQKQIDWLNKNYKEIDELKKE